MSKLTEMIQSLCPNGVEYVKLGNYFRRIKGTPITALIMKKIANENGDITIYAGGKTVVNAFEEDIEKANITRVPAVLIQSRGIIDALYCDTPFTFKNEMWAYTCDNSTTLKFLCYYLKLHIDHFRVIAARRGSLPQISIVDTDDFEIPLPPLPIQQEIVRILDTFTQLQTELQTELQLRRKQYNYYREHLLTFGEDVERKKLGEIGKICMCKRVMKNETTKTGDIPFYKIGTFGKEPDAYISNELFEEYKSKYSYPKKGDILISASGTIGRTVVFDGEPSYFQDSNIVWIDNDETQVLNKFLYYIYSIAEWKTEGGTIKRLYNDNLAKLEIPLPPIEKQREIASILDKFSALTTSLTEGIPAEIELRRKQYNYYRELLLTFKHKAL